MSLFSDRKRVPVTHEPEAPPLRPVPLGQVPASPTPRLPKCPGIHYEAGSYNRDGELLIHEPLADAFLLHLARHLSAKARKRRPARLFCVAGPGGNGKTETLLALASRHGVDTLMIAGADLLPGPRHGASIGVINHCLDYIQAATAQSGRPCVWGFDDADSSILPEKPNVEQTDDTANTIGKIQAICNSPDRYTDANGLSIPLWWTVNSTIHFRPTLIRPGRCRLYNHEPDLDHKQRVVEFIYKPFDRDRKGLRKLVFAYQHRPISFFADLRNDLADAAITAVIQREGLAPAAIDQAIDDTKPFDLSALWAAAARRDRHNGGDFSKE